MNHTQGVARIVGKNRGSVIIMLAVGIFAVMAILGLAIDTGRLVVVKAQLAKACDGGALAGARILPLGKDKAEQAAYEYAQMNFGAGFMNTTVHDFAVSFGADPQHPRIAIDGTANMPTTFLRVVGIDNVAVHAVAEAERRPLSVAMVLDNSGSLDKGFNGVDAVGYLRGAADTFVGYFDDSMDKMSLTLFSTGTVLDFPLNHAFTVPMRRSFTGMRSRDDTNLSDPLASGAQQLNNDPDPASYRALVFFTDGRPTSLRGVFPVGGVNYDAVISGDQDPAGVVNSQLYQYDQFHSAINGVRYNAATFPNGMPKTVVNLQSLAGANFLQAARNARQNGIAIYAIGLGNPRATKPWIQPDARLLMGIANVPSGVDPVTGKTVDNPSFDASQPEGGFYFAPDADGLNAVFEQVAREIVLRLTQ
ncbi:MAG TPA: VWA domain-containing protein [Candidatus Krumholzibacteria bacterium]|nr:VWA domain-containing protein [Candidatus Krumholzibacteria bacterium]